MFAMGPTPAQFMIVLAMFITELTPPIAVAIEFIGASAFVTACQSLTGESGFATSSSATFSVSVPADSDTEKVPTSTAAITADRAPAQRTSHLTTNVPQRMSAPPQRR